MEMWLSDEESDQDEAKRASSSGLYGKDVRHDTAAW
jgi:hypothetical protein